MESHIVILGCGFGGLFAAQALAGAPVRVTVIDRANHHLFQPLLYQVATAGLSAPAIAAPIHPEWERDAPGLKTLEDAFEIRRRILTAYERAEREPNPVRRAPWLTFLIGFRNRIVVLIDWALAYWSFERNARIVAGTKGTPPH